MNRTFRTHFGRGVAAGAVSAALLVGGAGALAFAGSPSASHAAVDPAPTPTTTVGHHRESITLSARPMLAGFGVTVALAGNTKGVAAGSLVQLQELKRGLWVTIRATSVTKGERYATTTSFTIGGKHDLRAVVGKTSSPVVTVTVK